MSVKILIIDNDPALAGALKISLLLEGYDPEIAVNASDALTKVAWCNKNRNPFQLVIFDLIFADLPIVELITEIKEIQERITTIATSRVKKLSVTKSLMEIGCDAYLQKPFAIQSLIKIINQYFKATRVQNSVLRNNNLVSVGHRSFYQEPRSIRSNSFL